MVKDSIYINHIRARERMSTHGAEMIGRLVYKEPAVIREYDDQIRQNLNFYHIFHFPTSVIRRAGPEFREEDSWQIL